MAKKGCRGCRGKGARKIGPCDVCILVDGNSSDKDVTFCKACKAWICQNCRPSYGRRAIAMLREALGL